MNDDDYELDEPEQAPTMPAGALESETPTSAQPTDADDASDFLDLTPAPRRTRTPKEKLQKELSFGQIYSAFRCAPGQPQRYPVLPLPTEPGTILRGDPNRPKTKVLNLDALNRAPRIPIPSELMWLPDKTFDYETWWDELRDHNREKLLRDHAPMGEEGARVWSRKRWLRLKMVWRFNIERAMNFQYPAMTPG